MRMFQPGKHGVLTHELVYAIDVPAALLCDFGPQPAEPTEVIGELGQLPRILRSPSRLAFEPGDLTDPACPKRAGAGEHSDKAGPVAARKDAAIYSERTTPVHDFQ